MKALLERLFWWFYFTNIPFGGYMVRLLGPWANENEIICLSAPLTVAEVRDRVQEIESREYIQIMDEYYDDLLRIGMENIRNWAIKDRLFRAELLDCRREQAFRPMGTPAYDVLMTQERLLISSIKRNDALAPSYEDYCDYIEWSKCNA